MKEFKECKTCRNCRFSRFHSETARSGICKNPESNELYIEPIFGCMQWAWKDGEEPVSPERRFYLKVKDTIGRVEWFDEFESEVREAFEECREELGESEAQG